MVRHAMLPTLIARLHFLAATAAAAAPTCVRCPLCLDASAQACFPRQSALASPNCDSKSATRHIFCRRSLYECPGTGVVTYLPPLSGPELEELYTKHWRTGPAVMRMAATHKRPVGQSNTIARHVANRTGLQIVEMGCANALLLQHLAPYARGGGGLHCFETDAHFHRIIPERFAQASKGGSLFTTVLHRSLFNSSSLPTASVDLFVSSHVVEHLADPCAWISALQRILKPGGLVFTELPNQRNTLAGGQFHHLYMNASSFSRMMERGGFKLVSKSPNRDEHMPARTIRAVHALQA
jgi:2-polyprenyl-3-methyl-5-hydroxy-6-metoxy-1,4-benzoquinol methylase